MTQPYGPPAGWDFAQPDQRRPWEDRVEPGSLENPPPTENDPRRRRPKAQARVPLPSHSIEFTVRRRDYLANFRSPYVFNNYAVQDRPVAGFGVIIPDLLQQLLTPVIADLLFRQLRHYDYCKFQWALGHTPCMHIGPVAGRCYNYSTHIMRQGSYRGRIETCASGNSCVEFLNLDWPPQDRKQIPYPNRMWLCEEHIARPTHPNLIECHRVGTCAVCRRRERKRHPIEFSSCTCEDILQRRGVLCAACYAGRPERLINNFRHRVNRPDHHGKANRVITGVNVPGAIQHADYWVIPRAVQTVRQMLVDLHPCGSGCGRVRENQTEVMDCRSCGGMITAPLLDGRRQRRFEEIYEDTGTLLALNDEGIPVVVRDGSNGNGRRLRRRRDR